MKTFLIYGINFLLALLLARFEYASGNDKTIVIVALVYVILIVFNFVLGFMAQLDPSGQNKERTHTHFYASGVGLIVLAFLLMLMY
jgi:hypothetical protein